MRSRLSQTTENRTKRQLIFSLLGIVVVLFVLLKFGIPALTNLSLFLSSKNGVTQQDVANSNTVVPAPILAQSFSATNSATITVSGTAQPKQTVQLFVNDSQVDSQTVKDDGTFSFTGVNLTQQQNSIKAKAVQSSPSAGSGQVKSSDFSDIWTVGYIQKAPTLSVDSPHDGDTVSSTVIVKGKTDPDVRVTVNDLWAIVDSSGNYSYQLSVQNGDTQIIVVATDSAGNTTKQQLTVHHSQ